MQHKIYDNYNAIELTGHDETDQMLNKWVTYARASRMCRLSSMCMRVSMSDEPLVGS